jgi:predicted small lipoprotein YifL
MKRLTLLALLALAACGADGPPERPGAAEPGISVSGTVEFGITGGG